MDRLMLYSNGRYFVVAVDRDDHGEQSVVDVFAVVTAAGAALRYHPSLDSACDRLDCRLLEDARACVPSSTKTSPRSRH